MSILACNEISENRGQSEDENGIIYYTRTFRVESTVTNESETSVKAAPGVTRYSSHPDASRALARSIKALQDSEERRFWIVTIEYNSAPFTLAEALASGPTDPSTLTNPSGVTPSANSSNSISNPANKPWYLSYGEVHTTRVLADDLDSLPVVSSAKQPLEGGLEVPVTHPTFTLHAFKATASWQKKMQYTNAVNNAAVTIDGVTCPTYSLRCTSYLMNPQFENNQLYYEYLITYEYKEDLWIPTRKIDAGTIELQNIQGFATLQQVPIRDKSGDPINSPVPLDGNGAALTDPVNDDIVYLEFRAYVPRDFSQII